MSGIWSGAEPHEYILPDGYSVGKNAYEEEILVDANGSCWELADIHGTPGFITDLQGMKKEYVKLELVS